MKKSTTKTQRKIRRMLIICCIMVAMLLVISPIMFFVSIGSEWQVRKEIKQVSSSLSIENSKGDLEKIAQNNRILEIIAVDKNGAVVYTLKNMPIFADQNATVAYDAKTGLIKFDGVRISYFERDSILDSLINIGDDDWDFDDDDDDDRVPSFDYKFVEDNVYQTIAINDNAGGVVYIVCTKDSHVGLILYLVFAILGWSLAIGYFAATCGYIIYKKITVRVCPSCKEEIRRLSNHCTKCGVSLLPRMCQNCGTPAADGDQVCGECGNKLD